MLAWLGHWAGLQQTPLKQCGSRPGMANLKSRARFFRDPQILLIYTPNFAQQAVFLDFSLLYAKGQVQIIKTLILNSRPSNFLVTCPMEELNGSLQWLQKSCEELWDMWALLNLLYSSFVICTPKHPPLTLHHKAQRHYLWLWGQGLQIHQQNSSQCRILSLIPRPGVLSRCPSSQGAHLGPSFSNL